MIVYKWQGLTQSYEIRMPYDSSEKSPAVLSLETADAPVPPEPKVVEAPQPAPIHLRVARARYGERNGWGNGGGASNGSHGVRRGRGWPHLKNRSAGEGCCEL